MANRFSVNTLVLGSQSITATGNTIFVNSNPVLAGGTGSNISVTGSNIIGYTEISGAGSVLVFQLANKTIISGSSSVSQGSNSDGINLSGNLTSSGQTLYNYFSSLSGNLQQTGSVLDNRINTLTSNYSALSGALSNSGSSLLGSINTISGNLGLTGQNLQNQINSIGTISNIVFTTGTQTIIGNKTISGNFILRDPFPSGQNFTGSSGLVFLTGSGARFQIISTGNQILVDFYGRSITGGTWNIENLAQLGQTGSTLFNNSSSTGSSLLNSIGTLSGNLILTGQKTWTDSDNNSRNISGNWNALSGSLSVSGSNLQIQINSLSGKLSTTGTLLSSVTVSGSSIINSPDFTGVGSIAVTKVGNNLVYISGSTSAGAGEVNTASNLGIGLPTYDSKSSVDLRFNTIITGSGMHISLSGNNIQINLKQGTLNEVPKFSATSQGLISSNIFSVNGLIGVNNTIPIQELDISGEVNINNSSTFNYLVASGSINNYQQINLNNRNSGDNASTDLVATNNIGDESSFYVDLGINSSRYTGLSVGLTGDTYCYSKANHFFIGNTVPNQNLYFFAGNSPTGSNGTVMLLNDSSINLQKNTFVNTGVYVILGSNQIEPSPTLNFGLLRIKNSGITIYNQVDTEPNINIRTRSENTGVFSEIRMASTRGGLTGVQPTQSGDILGQLSFCGASGFVADTTNEAYVRAVADENYSTSTKGSSIEFWNTITGSIGASLALKISKENHLILPNLRDPNTSPNLPMSLDLYNRHVAGRGFLHQKGNFDLGHPIGDQLWNKQVVAILPAAATTQTLLGTTATNSGTLSHNTTAPNGYMTVFTSPAQPQSHAYTSSQLVLSLGNSPGVNGFFYSSKFALTDPTGIYNTGITSGFRFFAGLTDAQFNAQLSSNDPTNNRFGVSAIKCTGGAQANRNDANWQITTKNNSTETLSNTNIPWNSGLYQVYLYAPSYPNTGVLFWELRDYSRSIFNTGIVTGALPLINNTMRIGVGIGTLQAVKTFRTNFIYAESAS